LFNSGSGSQHPLLASARLAKRMGDIISHLDFNIQRSICFLSDPFHLVYFMAGIEFKHLTSRLRRGTSHSTLMSAY
jgi:hypothetical protein